MPAATLTIPQPCAESWAAMTPTATGRHCAACRKTVVDFTQKTDAEVLAALARAAGGNVCGRFKPAQLGRPLQPSPAVPAWRTWLGALLTVGSLSTLPALRATGQTAPGANASGGPTPSVSRAAPSAAPPSPAGHFSPAPAPVLDANLPAADTLMLRGVVQDASTKEALPGVTVLITGTTIGTSTNAAGEFKLPLAPGSRQVQLRAMSVGYEMVEQTVAIAPAAASGSLSLAPVVLKASVSVMGEIIGPARKPYPWHPRAFWFWLTRPLRR